MAEAATEKKIAKPQPSRKGKKAWRKNVDITHVEEGLEEMRQEERVRGKVTEVEDLFTIDTSGDANIRRSLAKERPLRVEQILAQRSAVPAVIARVRAANTEKKISKYTKQKVDQIAKRKLEGGPSAAPKKKIKSGVASYDMWDDETPAAASPEEDQSDYLEPVKAKKVKAPSTLKKKPAALVHQPAIEIAHAGASYNPTVEAHQELLKQAHEIEVRKLEAAEKLNEKLSYRKELDDLAGELEASLEDEDEDGEEEEGEKDEGSVAAKKEAKRKTRTQRNKEKRLRLEKIANMQKQHEKDIRKQIDLVKEIEKELNEHQKKIEDVAQKRQEIKENAEKKGVKRLGKHFIKERPIDVQLQDELSETLRQLKPEGNLLLDHQHSFQRRNVVEARVPVKPHSRYTPKVYERRAFKQFDAKQKY
ncbi:ribosome biogenesis protein Nop53/GLTSCR2 [Dichotomocladium elegans]|nr:ribosome biogenesis protein Nop53/GLTSCR2 [Dichotomocladium elegans]